MRRQKQSILKPEFKNILPWVNLIRSHKTSQHLLLPISYWSHPISTKNGLVLTKQRFEPTKHSLIFAFLQSTCAKKVANPMVNFLYFRDPFEYRLWLQNRHQMMFYRFRSDVKQSAYSWSSSLFCLTRNSGQMTIGKTHLKCDTLLLILGTMEI